MEKIPPSSSQNPMILNSEDKMLIMSAVLTCSNNWKQVCYNLKMCDLMNPRLSNRIVEYLLNPIKCCELYYNQIDDSDKFDKVTLERIYDKIHTQCVKEMKENLMQSWKVHNKLKNECKPTEKDDLNIKTLNTPDNKILKNDEKPEPKTEIIKTPLPTTAPIVIEKIEPKILEKKPIIEKKIDSKVYSRPITRKKIKPLKMLAQQVVEQKRKNVGRKRKIDTAVSIPHKKSKIEIIEHRPVCSRLKKIMSDLFLVRIGGKSKMYRTIKGLSLKSVFLIKKIFRNTIGTSEIKSIETISSDEIEILSEDVLIPPTVSTDMNKSEKEWMVEAIQLYNEILSHEAASVFMKPNNAKIDNTGKIIWLDDILTQIGNGNVINLASLERECLFLFNGGVFSITDNPEITRCRSEMCTHALKVIEKYKKNSGKIISRTSSRSHGRKIKKNT
ncbi:hypothetical protein A3Q56_02901 [Intoshia linei]|uniref:Uncharacterized protein n=1 Tax=Intoshia linei TaxID=1819745 RepID=A0A177B6Z8_9BILA|nr:hypothetical protein A3Q56_02901 [Intoshia linei]